MIFNEIHKDLLTVGDDYSLAHCIASDLIMGEGIAVPMNAKFNLRELILLTKWNLKHPTCIITGRVFNLITKEKSWHKPTLENLSVSVYLMKQIMQGRHMTKVAMPRIGCGLDNLDWQDVSLMLKNTFRDTDIEILVCYL